MFQSGKMNSGMFVNDVCSTLPECLVRTILGGRKAVRVDNDKVFSRFYALGVTALAVAWLVYLVASRQLYWSITLTFLAVGCVLAEWQVIRLPQGDYLTLSPIFVLLTLVFTARETTTPFAQTVGALEVIVIGSLVGYGLMHRPSIFHLLFYVAHHILSVAAAGAVFVFFSERLPYWFLESFHVVGVTAYIIVLSLTSMLLTHPINRRIIKEDKLPQTNILYAVFLAPIALIVYYFFDSRGLDPVGLIILILPIIGVLGTFRLYVNIDTTFGEVNQLYRISREFVAAMSQDETLQKVSESIVQALSELIVQLDACFIYAQNAEANEYVLINGREDIAAPQVVVPGHGLLGRAVLNSTGIVANDVTLEDALTPEERRWPPKTAVLSHPMFAEQRKAGLLLLIRKDKGFTAEEFRLVTIVANQAGVMLHNAQMYERSRQMADIDRQLGILNQAAFTQQAERAFGKAQVAAQTVAVLLGDIDDFRNVNNVYGHQSGDRVLAGVASLMKQTIGSQGFVGRWGGEEFVATLPDIDDQEAVRIADLIRQRVQDYEFQSVDGRNLRATISIGVAVFPRDAGDFISLHKQADRAAYLAKKTGKNRVCLYEDRKELIELTADGSQVSVVSSMAQESET